MRPARKVQNLKHNCARRTAQAKGNCTRAQGGHLRQNGPRRSGNFVLWRGQYRRRCMIVIARIVLGMGAMAVSMLRAVIWRISR